MTNNFQLPDTGLVNCYDKSGKQIAPAPGELLYQQDGSAPLHPLSYKKLGNNGIELPTNASWEDGLRCVKDHNTGLIWEVKSPVSGDVNFAEDQYTWNEISSLYVDKLNKANYGGYSDWRVPNKDEVRSIVDYNKMNPAIDTNYFQNTQPGIYWCANTYQMQPYFAWVIFMGFGSATASSKNKKQFIRAVRGGYEPLFGKMDTSRFKDHGDGTISDSVTGLMWQQGDNPRMNWFEALKYFNDMDLAGYNDWRLPNIKELNTILNLNRDEGWWYFKEFFPIDNITPPLLHYFSSSLFNGDFVWVKNFNYGYDGYYGGKMAPLLSRGVRNIDGRPKTKIFLMPGTGQKQCFDDEGSFLDTTENTQFKGQDGDFAINPCAYQKLGFKGETLPDSAEAATGWMMVKDTNTGLIWEVKSLNEKSINPYNKKYSLKEAYQHIETLNKHQYGGYSDWRLPHREELRSIVQYDDNKPTIHTHYFPGTLIDLYWSDDSFAPNKNMQWGIYFGYGCSICFSNDRFYLVRAVRGGNNPAFGDPLRYNLLANKDGTVIDKNTGLMWMQDEPGEMSLIDALNYCHELELAGHYDWRLPSMKEIATLIDLSCPNGNWYNKEIFPGIKTKPLGFYWSSTTFEATFGWGVNFQFGYDGYYADKKNGKYCFKPVRNYQTK